VTAACPAPTATATATAPFPAPRLGSLDAYRGFIMLLMASGGFGIPAVAQNLPGSAWNSIAPWFDHAAWAGGVLWDMIQPAFMFMVGVAAAFSVQKRLERSDSWGAVLRHAAIRALVLVLLAVLLASNSKDHKQTNWLFTNVLGQIGLGYFFLVLLVKADKKLRIAVFVAILAGYWAAFALWPVGAAPDAASLDWMKGTDLFTGFFAHWNPHTNFAAAFDRWFLNLFPRSETYTVTHGGYQTLNFVPSLATMLLGLMVGDRLRKGDDAMAKLGTLAMWGVGLILLGLALGYTVCPIIKRIWTPSWALWSGGIVILMLAAFYAIMDIRGWKRWAFPLTIVGMNSIAVYMASQLTKPWIRDTLTKTFGSDIFKGPYGPMVERCSVLFVIWLMCLWLWRQKAFLRI
jgi:predicted acyltransferase